MKFQMLLHQDTVVWSKEMKAQITFESYKIIQRSSFLELKYRHSVSKRNTFLEEIS